MDSTPPPPPPPPFSTPPVSSGPPPVTSPPVFNSPKNGPAPRKSRGWMIFAIILILLLLVSVITNIGQFVERIASFGMMRHEPGKKELEKLYIEDNDSKNNIAVVEVEGIIASGFNEDSGDMVETIKDQLDRAAEKDENVSAVILKVNSPGGEVLAADEIARAVREFQEDNDIPVVASMGSLAASGGYYVSAPCRWIVANELTITGSIGVIMHGWNYRGLMDKLGIAPDTYKSGKFKDMLSGERRPEEIPPEEHAMVQALIDETYGKFTNTVAVGRAQSFKDTHKAGHELAKDWASYADGRVVSGTKALELGFVDETGNFDTAVARAEKLAGLKSGDSNIIEYQPHKDLSSLLHLLGKTEARPMKVDFGVKLPEIPGGHLYYIWPGYLN